MAPKRSKGGLPGWAKGVASSSSAPAASSADKLLLDKEGSGPAKKRRQLGRRRSEEQTERSLEQHFSHFAKSHLEATRVEGLTARERILRDIRDTRDAGGGKRLGAGYWRDLVNSYSDTTMVVQLVVRDKGESVRDGLVQGLGSAMKANPATRSIEPLVAMLQHSTTPLNRREVVGLFAALSSVGQGIGRANVDLLLVETMKYIVRHTQQDTMKAEISAMRTLFDAALARQFLRLKKAGVQVLTWLQTHMELATMLLDKVDIEAVMSAKGTWQNVGPQVARLTWPSSASPDCS
jgi:hypothetical protein